MTAPSLQETLAELNALSQYFIDAENTIRDGKLIDMTLIDQRVSKVCAAVQSAIPEQQEVYLPELTALLNLLNSCELAVRMMQPAPDANEDKAGNAKP